MVLAHVVNAADDDAQANEVRHENAAQQAARKEAEPGLSRPLY